MSETVTNNGGAKMRETLMYAYCQLTMAIHDDAVGGNVLYLAGCMREVANKCLAALAAPRRNCDVGTVEEQKERFFDFCARHILCEKCPLQHISEDSVACPIQWSQKPYEEGGAE